MMPVLIQFLIGLLFGGGLVVAGMSDPAKVLNFLDVLAIPQGTWDPSLAFVMGGGVVVAALGYAVVLKQPHPLFDKHFHLPTKTDIDARVLIGPAIFGIGWGLAGFCPGPALTALGTGTPAAFLFAAAMLAGMWLAKTYGQRSTALAEAPNG
jgi:uncharacterized protein